MLEESKIWVLLALVSIFGAFGYGAHYLSATDEANVALQESKSKLVSVRESLAFRKKHWGENEQSINQFREETEKTATLLKARDLLNLRYGKALSELKYTLESMKNSVEEVRSNAPGTELGEITLANGKVLRAAKIRKVEETGISMIHADGIGTVPVNLLPDSLKEQYDLGPNALVPMIQEAQTALLQKSEKGSSNKLSDQPSSSTPEVDKFVGDTKVKKN